MPSLSWKKAARLAGLGLTNEQKAADDWPDAFELKQIAILQYPGDGTQSGGHPAKNDRKALLGVLAAAVKEGGVPTEQRAREVKATKEVPIRRRPYEGGYESVSWVTIEYWRSIGGKFRTVSDGFKTEYFTVVFPVGLCDWLTEQGEEPSEHIREWVRSSATVAKELRPDSQAGIVARVLGDLKKLAAENDIEIDLQNMPGQKAQFLDLLRRLEPSFKNMKGVQSLDRYLKGQCAWSLRAKSNQSAESIYRKLFPKTSDNPGAVSGTILKT